MSRWAYVLTKIPARARPSASAKIITRLDPLTPEQTQNLVQALDGQINKQGEYWVRVRLPILPNGSTGWVPRGALGTYNKIWTHLVIDRRLFSATLYRRGVADLHDASRRGQAVLAYSRRASITCARRSPASRT